MKEVLDTARKGVVLLLTFIVIVTLAAIAVAFLSMTSVQTKGSGYDIVRSQALWAAEAGLEDVKYKLKNDSAYRDAPSTVNAAVGSGTYSVAVSKNGRTYNLTSTGTVDILSRKVTQSAVVKFPAAFDYAVFGNTNRRQLKIKDNVMVSGDVYYGGDVKVEEDAGVTNGLVYADSVTGDGTYTEASGDPNPIPAYPVFDTTFYDNAIATAESQASSNWTLKNNSTYDLGGGTVYYKRVKIKNNATVTGTGTIVATKDVTIRDNANISSNVTIITKKSLKVQNSAVIQSGALIYARKNITLKNSASVTGSLLAPERNKTVMVKDNAAFTGIIYAAIAKLRGNAAISGSIVANKYTNSRVEDNVTVTYDRLSLPGSMIPGFQNSEIRIGSNPDWDEVAP